MRQSTQRCSLNEGRGINPGDTVLDKVFDVCDYLRSTKAGA